MDLLFGANFTELKSPHTDIACQIYCPLFDYERSDYQTVFPIQNKALLYGSWYDRKADINIFHSRYILNGKLRNNFPRHNIFKTLKNVENGNANWV